MNTTLFFQLFLQVVLIALNAIFACAEIAVISVKDQRLELLADGGNKSATKLLKLKQQPSGFLSTIQIAITLSGFLGSAFAADNFSEIIVDAVMKAGINIPVRVVDSISVILITFILSYFTLVFGELVPKRIAMKKAEKISLKLAPLIYFISKLFAPIVWLLTKSISLVLRLINVEDTGSDEKISEEDIREMALMGTLDGSIDKEENEIIQNVFEFDDTPVGKFLTHRTEIDLIMLSDSVDKWNALIHKTRHSHYLVCKDDLDDVFGVLSAKDYFRIKDKTKENIIKNAIKPARFVPESITADKLFRIMKKSKNHFSVVLDEYGGLLGIVTMNDLLEQLVGSLDNYDNGTALEQDDIVRLGENKWLVQGYASLLDVQKELGLSLPADEFDTFGGFIISKKEIIPEENEIIQINLDGYSITTAPFKDHRVVSAIITKE